MKGVRLVHRNFSILLFLVACAIYLLTTTGPILAQDRPYFVSYSHDLEEPGEICVEAKTALAKPDVSGTFGAAATEFEYGVREWWTAEAYFDVQATDEDSAMSTGYRLESRVRLTKVEHLLTPVIYVEYGNISGADKTFLEVVGHDIQTDLSVRNDLAGHVHKHEGEFRLILSSDVESWNFAINFISEKNLGHAPWEFGYAWGASRPLRRASVSNACHVCLDKFVTGVEMYGGLGERVF